MEMVESERRRDSLDLPLPTAHHSTIVKFLRRKRRLRLRGDCSPFYYAYGSLEMPLSLIYRARALSLTAVLRK